MSEAGLVRITHHSLTFGICCLYLGWNPNGPSGA
jgi:hypothetical protein